MLQNLIAQFITADKVRKVIDKIFLFYVKQYSKKDEEVLLVISRNASNLNISLFINNKKEKNISDKELEEIITK